MWPDVTRCGFSGFGASSLDIEVFCWVATSDFNQFTAIAEELDFGIAAIVERAGTSFAFPSQSLHLARESGIVRERADAATAAVGERGELSVPEPSPELREKLLAHRAWRPNGDRA